jgi:hypothetical protein
LRRFADDTCADEINEARVHCLGMNAKVVAIPKLEADKSRQSADPHLQAGAVRHQARDRAAEQTPL